MIKLFANNRSIVILLIPLFVISHLVLGYYFKPFHSVIMGQENLWLIDFKLIEPFVSMLLTTIFICANAILINYIFNRFDYFDRLNFLPSFFYILLIFLFPISFYFCEDLVAHTFFILSFLQLLRIQHNEDARNLTFLSGLFLGIATTFLPEYILLIVLIYFTLFSIRPFVFREYLLPLFGFIFPFLWVYLVHSEFVFDLLNINSFLAYTPAEELEIALASLIILTLLLLAYKRILERRTKSSIRHKKIMNITGFIFFFSLGIIIVVFIFFQSYFYFTILLVILPLILPFTLLNDRPKWLPETLIYLLIFINIIKFLY